MKEVQLTQGKIALVDDADAVRVLMYRWSAVCGDTGLWYAKSRLKGTSPRSVYLHRFILGLSVGDPRVDHRNGDGLDCQRLNLRIATAAQNTYNMKVRTTSTTGLKGVTPRRGRWDASIQYEGRRCYLGTYVTPQDAARVYDAKARELFGEFARINFPDYFGPLPERNRKSGWPKGRARVSLAIAGLNL